MAIVRVIKNLNELKDVKKNKYGAQKTVVDGITFDSKAEALYYMYLETLRKSGKVKSFNRQVRIPLLDGFNHPSSGKRIQGIVYVADFEVVYADDSIQVVDVKGKRTTEFNLKAKMFLDRYQVPLVLAKYDYTTHKFYHEEIYA